MKDILKHIFDWLMKMASSLLDNLNHTLKAVGLPTISKNQIASAVAKELGKQTVSRGMDKVFSFIKKLNPIRLVHKLWHPKETKVGSTIRSTIDKGLLDLNL